MSPRRPRVAWSLLFAVVTATAFCGGCGPVEVKTRKGVYHRVGKHETLWGICHAYGVNMQAVCLFNGIRDPERLSEGQRLFIPGATALREVAVRRPTTSARGASGDRGPSGTSPSPGSGRSVRKTERGRAEPRFLWPVRGNVTSWFGIRDGRRHNGIDIAAPNGTPIRAAEAGTVLYSDNKLRGYGNLIIVRHARGWSTVYAHNARNLVQVEDFVDRGEIIGEVGDSGNARGSHLHFEVRRGARAVDPVPHLP